MKKSSSLFSCTFEIRGGEIRMFNLESYGNRVLKQSIFGHFLSRGKVCCAYNALKIITIYFNIALRRHIISVTNKPIFEVLENVPKKQRKKFVDVLTAICNAYILVPEEYNELDYLKQLQEMAFLGPRIRVLVLHMTDYCNLCCKYCFIEGNIPRDYIRKNMSKEVVQLSIDKFGKVITGQLLPKPPSIVFYGGEPLVNWESLQFGLEYLQQKQLEGILPNRIDKILITNGTIITPRIAETLKKYSVQVSISIDGPEEIHNLNRVDCNGKGSYEKTLRGFHALKKVGIRPTVSCVLSRESLVRAQDIMRWLLEELEIRAPGFNHVSIVPHVNQYDPEYETGFGKALIQVQEIIQAEYPEVYERRMNHKLNSFLDRHILRADCTGCGEQMSISPDGKIGICQGYMGGRKTFNGDVFEEDYTPMEDSVFIEWAKRSPLTMEQCYGCIALSTCGGGCPRNADFINGSIWEVDSAFCHFAKEAQEWMIWKKYEID